MFEMLIGSFSNAIEGPPGPPGVEFLGEVNTVGFINGTELASAIGLNGGITQHTAEPWLHFELDGKTLYVAKKPYRSHISWNNINIRGAVFGTKTVEINGRTYKVRLLKSVASGDTYISGSNGVYDHVGTHGSEWNRLFYPIYSGNSSPVSKEGIHFGSLAQYTGTDLVVHHTGGNGSFSWCQETPKADAAARVVRGAYDVSYLRWSTTSTASSDYGWRPVLELVE